MQQVDIDMRTPKPLQARLAFLDDVTSRKSAGVGRIPHGEAHLACNHQVVAAALERFTQYAFTFSEGVDVGGVDHVHALLGHHVDHAARISNRAAAGLGEKAFATKSHGAKCIK